MNIEMIYEANPKSVIAIYDSGLGGLSVVRELMRELPDESLLYFADNIHMPYGPRSLGEVRAFAVTIAEQLLMLPAKTMVVACNTASAAALKTLRETFPDVPFVGMEPAVKPAAQESRTGKVGVLATFATFQGQLFESVVERFARDVEVIRQPCPGLAEFIETHPPDHPALEPLLEKFIRPLVDGGVDTLVLACTHYPLVKDAIARVAGEKAHIVDPSPAIARRTRQVLEDAGLLRGEGGGDLRITVSGERDKFSQSASIHLGREVRAEESPFCWVPMPR